MVEKKKIKSKNTIIRNLNNTEITKNDDLQEHGNSKFTSTDILNDNNNDFNNYSNDKKITMECSKGKLKVNIIINFNFKLY